MYLQDGRSASRSKAYQVAYAFSIDTDLDDVEWPWVTLNGVQPLFCIFFAEKSMSLLASYANYVTVVEDRRKMSAKCCLPVPVFHFRPKLTHPAALSFCDSWATCFDFVVKRMAGHPQLNNVIYFRATGYRSSKRENTRIIHFQKIPVYSSLVQVVYTYALPLVAICKC